MSETLLALRQINVGLLLADGLNAAQIAASDSSPNQDAFQQTVLSQIRRMIWGDDLTHHWHDDFIAAGVQSLAALSAGAAYRAAVCQPSDSLGQAVTVDGNFSGGLLSVQACDLTLLAQMPAIGMIVDKPTPTTCLVQMRGQVDLTGAGLVAGSRYWVGPGALPVAAPPTPAAGSQVYVQVLGVALDADYLELTPSPELLRLVGPAIPPPAVISPLYPFAMPVGPPLTSGSGPTP